jgi:hypothetical protein
LIYSFPRALGAAATGGGIRFSDSAESGTPSSGMPHAAFFGFLRRIAHAIQVCRNVEDIFDYRYRRIEQMFGHG